LGQTARGIQVAKAINETGMDYIPHGKALWTEASREFAGTASGTVHVFQNEIKGVDRMSIWAQTEYPTLLENDVNIGYHNVGGPCEMQTFKKLPYNLVESSEGYSIQLHDQNGILYKEHGVALEIDAEALAIDGFAIYTDNLPGDDQNVARIVNNVRDALAFLGLVSHIN